MNVQHLLTAAAVREAAHRMLASDPTCWTVDLNKLPDVADLVATVTRRNYPDLRIPFHSRWRHFDAGGLDRWAALTAQWGHSPPREVARRAFDLVIPSVLSDAGSGGVWRYADPDTGKTFTSSEGLALASLQLYKSLATAGVLRARALQTLTEAQFESIFQVSETNPLAGVAGRVSLLRALGNACGERPGSIADAIFAASRDGAITAPAILSIVLDRLGPIWPSRISVDGIPLGDSWRYDPWQGIVPFHKLSQWLTYSLIEPLQQAGLVVTDIDGLTGLAEYRNGGLFVDGGVLRLKDESMQAQSHRPDSNLVIEWRALTLALIDRLHPMVAERLGLSVQAFPLPCLLEGGTWSAGRHLAQQLRPDRSPPITIQSDGTVF